MYIRDGIDELTLQVTHFLDSVKMCKTIHTQMHIACGTMKNMCPHSCFVAPHMNGTLHLVIVWMTGQVCPPWLIANWLQSAPVHGQSELLVIVDDLIFLNQSGPRSIHTVRTLFGTGLGPTHTWLILVLHRLTFHTIGPV